MSERSYPPNAVAIVGLACRFPGAPDPDTFWSNLAGGVESLRTFSREELIAAGCPPATVDHPAFVSAHGALEDIAGFDATFFGYAAGDAALIDPQQRLFLECAHEALESAGVRPGEDGPVTGVFGGCGLNFYLIRNVAPLLDPDDAAGVYQAIVGSDKDFLTSRIAYKLGLSGPAMTIQAACATSLVAVHVACQSLLGGECDLALAGGVSLRIPQASGYRFNEGGIHSADGHCRAFDSQAGGTIGGSGGGVVVLKRLDDARRDGDRIHAVILGTAVNNDGSRKLNFTAPAVRGQAAVIAEARAVAGVDARTIGYAEMHGTGTALGDPIEIAAVRDALGAAWTSDWRCYIGSVKTNIGHLDAAAGIAGLIKAVLALQRGSIPPSLHFQQANPKIDFESGPLRVCTALTAWPETASPRRASVSSFGLGGSNAHLVLEEAPPAASRVERDAWRLVPLSAGSAGALDRMRIRLADHLRVHPEVDLADVSSTLARGRRVLAQCGVAVARSSAEASDALGRGNWQTAARPSTPPRVAFLFPGQGAQQVGTGRELYAAEPVFRAAMDAAAGELVAAGAADVRALLFREPTPEAEREIRRTVHAQAVLFALGCALAELWKSKGIAPDGVLGHSSGEYAAAVCAGVMSLPEAARALVARARLMDQLPAGVMAAIGMSEGDLRAQLPPELFIAAVNAPQLCTVAGSEPAMRELEARLAGRDVLVYRLQTAHAFHSPVVDPVLPAFRAAIAAVRLQSPIVPFYSAVTGARSEESKERSVVDAELWVRQIREPVLFGPALQALLDDRFTVFVEMGPGATLAGLTRRAAPSGSTIVPGVPATGDEKAFLTGLAHLWLAGCDVAWASLFTADEPRPVPLPTYSFERTRYWIEPTPLPREVVQLRPIVDESIGFIVPTWTRSPRPARADRGLAGRWLVFGEDDRAGRIVAGLRAAGAEVRMASDVEVDYTGVDRVLIASTLSARGAEGFDSLTRIARAMARQGSSVSEIAALTGGAADVTGGELLDPWQALALGPLLVIPEEFPGVTCRAIDVDLGESGDHVDAILAELKYPAADRVVALRNGHRWTLQMAPVEPSTGTGALGVLRPDGVYAITGGLGAIGIAIAQRMAAAAHVHLALIGRGTGHSQSSRSAALSLIETAGSSVLVYQADCADRRAMQDVFADLTQRYGRIHGVIHAAGVPGGGTIARRTDQEMSAVLRPKTTGTDIVAELLAGAGLDFLVFFSSINAYVPIPGQADYAAANRFLDVKAAALRRQGVRATSIDWDAWRGVGMAADANLPPSLRALREEELARFGLDPDAACDALWRVIGSDIGHVVASKRRSFVERPAGGDTLPVAQTLPAASITEGLARIWIALLGVSEIKPGDDFLQLGGHSLLATRVTFQIRQTWGCAVSVDEVFTHSRFESLAALVEARAATTGDREALVL